MILSAKSHKIIISGDQHYLLKSSPGIQKARNRFPGTDTAFHSRPLPVIIVIFLLL